MLINVKEINTSRYLFLFTMIIQNSSLIYEEQGCILCNSYYLIDIFLKVAQESKSRALELYICKSQVKVCHN